jgi:hypothetical protein
MDTTNQRDEAEWLTRMGRWGAYALTAVAVLALVFTMVNVQRFASAGHPWHSFEWWIAWLLDPMASITLGTAIVFGSILADYGRKEPWLTGTMWFAGIATWAMNIWVSAAAAVPSGILLHSVAPGLILLLAEAAPRVRRHFAEIRTELDTSPTGELDDVDAELESLLADLRGLSDRTTGDPTPDLDPAGDFPRVTVPPTHTPAGDEPAHPGTPHPGVELELVPTPNATTPPPGVDPTIYAAARELRDERGKRGLTTGRRVLMTELPTRLPVGYRVTDTTARQLARVLAA